MCNQGTRYWQILKAMILSYNFGYLIFVQPVRRQNFANTVQPHWTQDLTCRHKGLWKMPVLLTPFKLARWDNTVKTFFPFKNVFLNDCIVKLARWDDQRFFFLRFYDFQEEVPTICWQQNWTMSPILLVCSAASNISLCSIFPGGSKNKRTIERAISSLFCK